MLWPSSASFLAGQSAHRAHATAQLAVAFGTPDAMVLDARRGRAAELKATVHTIRVKFLAEQERKAAARRAAARRAAARRAAARRAAARAAAAARRAAARQAQAAQQAASGSATSSGTSGSPQLIASEMLASFGWGQDQFGCLDSLWSHESGWSTTASNPVTGAYGIPQALPGSKMSAAGPDWQTDAATQIRWGLGYIQGVYGSPCGAWSHEQATGWY